MRSFVFGALSFVNAPYKDVFIIIIIISSSSSSIIICWVG